MAATPSGCYILPKERKVIAPRLLLLQARRSIFNSATAAPVSRLTRKSRPRGRDFYSSARQTRTPAGASAGSHFAVGTWPPFFCAVYPLCGALRFGLAFRLYRLNARLTDRPRLPAERSALLPALFPIICHKIPFRNAQTWLTQFFEEPPWHSVATALRRGGRMRGLDEGRQLKESREVRGLRLNRLLGVE